MLMGEATRTTPPSFIGWRGNKKRGEGGRFLAARTERPADFEEMLVRIGRLACEAHYGVGRKFITRWLEECGKDRLIAKRREFVKAKEAERRLRLSAREMGLILSRSYPVDDYRSVSPALARQAAEHLRIVRNGGFAVSPTPDGGWRIGLRYCSPNELVDFAKSKGFDPSLTGPSE
jgi:hypothetical protein